MTIVNTMHMLEISPLKNRAWDAVLDPSIEILAGQISEDSAT